MNKFRPQDISKAVIFKQRLAYGRADNYNWQTRIKWYPVGMTKNKISILRRWQQIHHYASHTKCPASHWKVANALFEKNFLGSKGKASIRYLNTYSCHRWL